MNMLSCILEYFTSVAAISTHNVLVALKMSSTASKSGQNALVAVHFVGDKSKKGLICSCCGQATSAAELVEAHGLRSATFEDGRLASVGSLR